MAGVSGTTRVDRALVDRRPATQQIVPHKSRGGAVPVASLHALHMGERFDDQTGGPASWVPLPKDVQVHVWARLWLVEQWAEWQPRTRTSAVEALARFVAVLVPRRATTPPAGLRTHLVNTLPPGMSSHGDERCEQWLDRSCFTLGQLNRQILAAVERELVTGDDGQLLAASTAGRYRKVAKACIRRSVELDVLAADLGHRRRGDARSASLDASSRRFEAAGPADDGERDQRDR